MSSTNQITVQNELCVVVRGPCDKALYNYESVHNVFTGLTVENCDIAMYLGDKRVVFPNGSKVRCNILLNEMIYHYFSLKLLPIDNTKDFSVTLSFSDNVGPSLPLENSVGNFPYRECIFSSNTCIPTVFRQAGGLVGFALEDYIKHVHNTYFSYENISEKIKLIHIQISIHK